MSVVLAIAAVLATIYLVPFGVYAAASAAHLVELPADSSPARFLLGVLVTKAGTATAFVLLLVLPVGELQLGWVAYALVWLVMFVASEIGEAISGRTPWPEAILGVVSEVIYAPAASLVAYSILGVGA